ncbi:MAG TPA: peptide chain release factor-like protein [Candidatus Omnitrophota bacterium]|nr:peptide chain release factor-like protein [Candidatus Omnitrophota bacterium]HPD85604.1 peptide chain release factor-like protein [Candidatus Omnitrophota bacterium]HRZ04532.1 peptide chain release factor-like protein [Candidatus Omnitrophota bacterium]
MSLFNVSPQKEQELANRMRVLGVREADIEESFIRSSGPGGQNVNKVSTCVFLRHRPTGMTVKCQETRQQALNRFLARRLLLDEIERKQTGVIQERIARIEKIRRQKRKRSKRAKEKMLNAKHFHAEKKQHRQSISPHRMGD